MRRSLLRVIGTVRGRSSVGRALQWHCRGQGFDSPRLHFGSCGFLREAPRFGSGGGTGRRAGFRFLWGQPREGSSPSSSIAPLTLGVTRGSYMSDTTDRFGPWPHRPGHARVAELVDAQD